MAKAYDLIFQGGTVVNQDGEAVPTSRSRNGRIAAIGDRGANAAEVLDCQAGSTSCPASSIPRCISANRA